MSALFNNLKKYAESWTVARVDALDTEDLTLIITGEVVKSTYGRSIKFHLREGGFFYIPMDDRDETYQIGDEVDLTRILVKTLKKEGENDIQRIVFKEKDITVNI